MKESPELRGRLQSEFLAKVANIVAAGIERDSVLRGCLEELKRIIDYDSVTVALFSEGLEWELAIGLGFKDEIQTRRESARVLTESPILKQMASDLQPVMSSDVHHLPGWIWIPGAKHVRSFIAVPMITSNHMIGVLMLDKSKEDFFDEEDLALAQTLSHILAVAVEKTQLYEAMEHRLSEQEALLAVSKAVSSSLDVEVVLNKLAEQMARAINMTSAYISTWDLVKGTSTVIAEYITPQAAEREKVSDLGETYDLFEDFGNDQERLSMGETLVEHVDGPEVTAEKRRHYRQFGAKSVMVIPLMIKGKIVGHADLWESRRRREYSGAEIALCNAIAQQAAVAIENTQLFAQKKEQLRLAKTLQEVGALLTSRLSLSEVFDQIFHLLAKVVSYNSASVHLVDSNGNIYVAAGIGFATLKTYRNFAAVHGVEILKRFSKGRKVKVIPDTNNSEDWITIPGLDFVQSWIGAALMIKGHIIGVLNIDSSQPNTYNDRVGETVFSFANQAAVAIENARLYEETRQRANEILALYQVAVATSLLPDIDSLLEKITKSIAESLYTEHFGFLLVDEGETHLIPHQSFHGAPNHLFNEPVPMDKSVCGKVYLTGKPIIIGDVITEEKYLEVATSTLSEIAVPLTVRDKVIGVINVESSQMNAFSTNDLRFLMTLAGQVATFIERSDLYEAQRKYTAHLALEVSQRTAALQGERDRMQAILDNAGEGIFFTDDMGAILYVNSTMTNVTGYSVEELLDRLPDQWPGIRHTPDLLESLQKAIEAEEGWKNEMIGRRKDGRTYDLYLTVAPIFANDGTLSGLVGVHSDISYLKEVERLKSRFIANVSHELRTPLTVIETYTTLLKKGKSERHDFYLSVLSQETRRLTQLIQDVLDLSRLEAESVMVSMASLDLGPILEQVVNTFIPHADNKAITLELELEEPLTPIWANNLQIEQVVTNLINNALLYTDQGGRVFLQAWIDPRVNKDMVFFSVSDTGPGIPEEDIPHIFERFFRSQTSEDDAIRGTGLGLAICKEIVERHNGTIVVESEAGKGAVFTVGLPVQQNEEVG